MKLRSVAAPLLVSHVVLEDVKRSLSFFSAFYLVKLCENTCSAFPITWHFAHFVPLPSYCIFYDSAVNYNGRGKGGLAIGRRII